MLPDRHPSRRDPERAPSMAATATLFGPFSRNFDHILDRFLRISLVFSLFLPPSLLLSLSHSAPAAPSRPPIHLCPFVNSFSLVFPSIDLANDIKQPFLARFSVLVSHAPCDMPHHAFWMLVGAWNPMVIPIHTSSRSALWKSKSLPKGVRIGTYWNVLERPPNGIGTAARSYLRAACRSGGRRGRLVVGT